MQKLGHNHSKKCKTSCLIGFLNEKQVSTYHHFFNLWKPYWPPCLICGPTYCNTIQSWPRLTKPAIPEAQNRKGTESGLAKDPILTNWPNWWSFAFTFHSNTNTSMKSAPFSSLAQIKWIIMVSANKASSRGRGQFKW